MKKSQPKLFTRKHAFLIIPALIIGASISLFKEFKATGTIRTVSIVISGITLLIGLSIFSALAWWGNKPES